VQSWELTKAQGSALNWGLSLEWYRERRKEQRSGLDLVTCWVQSWEQMKAQRSVLHLGLSLDWRLARYLKLKL
jgi:hypothetical protein